MQLVEPSAGAGDVRRVALLSVHTSPLDQPGSGDGGGLNVYVSEVARRLGARGVEVDIFTRATAPGEPVRVPFADGVTVHRLVAGPPAPVDKDALVNHLCSYVLEAARHARGYDLVHAHYWLSGWVGRRLARRCGIPLVQTFHTFGMMKNRHLAPGDVPERPLRLAAEERIARAADRIAVLTCGEARLLHREWRVSGSRIMVVPAGVDMEKFGPQATAHDPAVAAQLPRARPLLAFVGRLQPLKAPDVAVRTLAAVRRTHPTAELVIVGGTSGSGRGRTGPEQLSALAADLGVADAVHLLPAQPQDRLAALYRQADLVLVPSRSETFGLVALEAQACGTPVVAADVGGLPGVVRDGGTLVAGHEPADHAAAAARYLDDPELARATGTAGVAFAATATWDRTVDRLLDVYRAVVRGRQPARQAS